MRFRTFRATQWGRPLRERGAGRPRSTTRVLGRIEPLESRHLLAAVPVISEFLAVNQTGLRDEDGDRSDWLELANLGDQPISLNGWYLTDAVDQLSRWRIPDITLSPGTHRVIFASGKDRTDPAQVLHTNFRLSGDGEPLALVQPDGTTVADAYWPSYPAQSADVSYGRFGPANEVGYFAQPTPGSVNSRPPSPSPDQSMVVTEIMYHPASQLDVHEYIELTNASPRAVSLDGWSVGGGIELELPALVVSPGQAIVLAADPISFATVYQTAAPVVGPWSGRLSNQSDRITLYDASDRVVDQVRYADEGEWSVRQRGPDDRGHQGWVWRDDHDGGGKSLELRNAFLPNDTGQNWGASFLEGGTPGAPNSIAANNVAPLILDVRQLPLIPRSDEAVSISARLLDESTVAPEATLHWRVDGAATFQQIAMRDDGQGGDVAAGDGVFHATLPPHSDRTVVEYFLSAADASGESRTWPAATFDAGQATNALYQVMDDIDPPVDWNPSDPPVYFQIMTAAERSEFTNIDRLSNAQMNATFLAFTSNGWEQRHNAGIRIRGSGSRTANPPNNRINLPSDRPLQGVTALNFQVVSIQNQIAGSLLFRLAGLPAAQATAAVMYSNGQNLRGDGGLYAHVEPLNGEFADNHFPLDGGGNLYKGRRPDESPPGGQGAGLAYFGPDPGPYVSYTKLSNESQADWSDVIELTDVLNNTPDETYLQELARVVDIDQWLRFLAMNVLVSNTEGGLVNGDRLGDDYAMYRGIDDPRFRLIPHDLDSILSQVTRPFFTALNVAALERLLLHPELRPRYYEHFLDLANQVFQGDDTEALLREHLQGVASDAQLQNILNFLRRRADFVRASIPTGIQYRTGIAATNGRVNTTETALGLYGTVDYRANSVLINGRPATFDPATSQWQLGSFNADLIPFGAEWQYLDDGSDQGTAWRAVEFAPPVGWKTGPAQLGYGDGDEATVVSFGEDPANKHATTYFRYEFQVEDPSRYHTLVLQLLRDDGAAVYLNGQEVVRDNLPDGALTFETLASSQQNGGNERRVNSFGLDVGLLRTGKNVLAVEVHQASRNSDDLSFNARLLGRFHPVNAGVPLQPGVNRLVIQAMSGLDGQGVELARETVEVWRDTGRVQIVEGELPAGTTTWTPGAGPYQVRGEVIVPDGAMLVIQPGTAVHFEADAELTVRGTLVARGTPQTRIQFTSVPDAAPVPDLPGLPDGPPRWDGIHFENSRSAENVIAFADVQYAQDSQGSIGVINSDALLEAITVRGTHLRMVFGQNASMEVRDSEFPDMFPGDEDPIALGLDNISEHIKIVGRTPAGGRLIIQGNRFGTNKGHNDVIDADSNRASQGPILQILDNVFSGAGDELIDLGGDVLVAGNLFRNVFKDAANNDRGYANAISTGDAGANTTTVVTRNIFYDVDHAINLKNAAATIFEYNTVVRVHPDFVDPFGNPVVGSAINLYVDEPGATPGKGAYAGHNIFWDLPRVFGNGDLPGNHRSVLQLHENVLSPDVAQTTIGQRGGTILNLGSGNRVGDPRLRDPANFDFSTLQGSLAINTSSPVIWGAEASAGAWVADVPVPATNQRSVTLRVGGPGLFGFRYRVNGGDWSDELPIGTGFDAAGTVRAADLPLENLADGEYQVEVIGRDFAGNWQLVPTVAPMFRVAATEPMIRLHEILADNRRSYGTGNQRPDYVELHNAGGTTVDLRGWHLTDDLQRPHRFTFTQSTPIAAGGFLVLEADQASRAAVHLEFGLSRNGDALYLLRPDGTLADSVEFGLQLPDQSIGRSADGSWRLNQPTPGAANVDLPTGDASMVRINEWLAASDEVDDFVELYNLDSLPVDLGRLWLSDAADGMPLRHEIAPLSFIGGRGFAVFQTGAEDANAANILPFGLSMHQETLGLSHADGRLIDVISYTPQTVGYSQGRTPDGASQFQFFETPTPGWINGAGRPGDFQRDERLDHADLARLCQAIQMPDQASGEMDLDRDGQVTRSDLAYLVEVLMASTFGDANLDGAFDSRDLVLIFQAGEYEDDAVGNSTWLTGDWNCDGEFSSSDLVLAFQSGGYVAAAMAHDSAISELF